MFFLTCNTACFGEDAQVTVAVKKQLLCQWKLPASQTFPVALQIEPAFSGQICGNFILCLISFLNIWSFSTDTFTCYVIRKCVTFACFALNTACSQWPVLFGQTRLDGFVLAVVVLCVPHRVSCARSVSRWADLCSSLPACHFFLSRIVRPHFTILLNILLLSQ